ncbi:hypothetical protein, partial [Acinetobacter baumannii]|uniref:hypothetical protein n=1 Tax=Acinetobacter baumannii TaxID=470 RepID=UPI001C06ECF2
QRCFSKETTFTVHLDSPASFLLLVLLQKYESNKALKYKLIKRTIKRIINSVLMGRKRSIMDDRLMNRF